MPACVDVWVATLLAVIAVSLLSLLGAITLAVRSLRQHTVLITLVAIAVGSLLGDAFLHLLPDATAAWAGFTPMLGLLVLAGFLPFFLLETVLRWNHAAADPHDHVHAHLGHEELHEHAASKPVAPYGWINLAGSGVHNLIDGIVIAASFRVDMGLGIATAVAVGLHEIPHELGDFAVLLRSGMAPRRALLFNFVSALMAILGAVAVLVLPLDPGSLERYALPITAGGFIYIAATDLVPELHHHTGDRKQVTLILVGLLGGLALMAGLLHLD